MLTQDPHTDLSGSNAAPSSLLSGVVAGSSFLQEKSLNSDLHPKQPPAQKNQKTITEISATAKGSIAYLHKPKPQVQHYTELKGAAGKKIFYRPERFVAKQLFNSAAPTAFINDQPYNLANLSISGIAIISQEAGDLPLERGEHVSVRLQYADEILFEAIGRLVRIETSSAGIKLAFSLVDHSINVADLLNSYNLAVMNQIVSQDQSKILAQVPTDYRLLCSDVRHLLRRYQSVLEEYERSARLSGTFTAPNRQAILERCQAHVIPQWRELWHRGNELVRPFLFGKQTPGSKQQLAAIKQYTEEMLTPAFLANDDWRRMYEKPYGYPGDFVLMESIYNRHNTATDLYAGFLGVLGLEMNEHIVTRMEWMRDHLANHLKTQQDTSTIVNVGCGIAKEVSSLPKDISKNAEFYLLDQESRALSRAYELAAQHGMANNTHCLNGSYFELIRPEGKLYQALPPINLAYSLGILDYLNDRRAKQFIASLYDRIAPGGELVIANLHDCDDAIYWSLEVTFDWPLIYRTKENMLSLAADLPNASVEVTTESTGGVAFLIIRKQG